MTEEPQQAFARRGEGNPATTRKVGAVEISPLQLLAVLLRHRYLVVGVTAVTTIVGITLTVLAPLQYTASASFMSQAEQPTNSRLVSLAGQFGIDIAAGSTDQSPEFYADLLETRRILTVVASQTFSFWTSRREGDTVQLIGTLPDLLQIEGLTEVHRHASAVRWLRESAVRISTTRETGVVVFGVTTPWTRLSTMIAARLIELVNDFNLETRQTQAAAERQFVEGRLAEAGDSLRVAEGHLRGFLQNNRNFQNSPALTFEHDRLQREVALHQTIYTSLAQAYEQARIREVRNTPAITVIEPPSVPVWPNPRRLILKTALGLILGGMLGFVLAVTREFIARNKDNAAEDFREFSSAWRETVDDVLSLGGLRRVAARTPPT